MAKLYEMAKVVRSKNSGPFEITIDVLFDKEENYIRVKDSGMITKDTVSKLYKIPLDSIGNIVFFDKALGIKITYDREVSSGTVGDRDVYGAQQYSPIMNLEI